MRKFARCAFRCVATCVAAYLVAIPAVAVAQSIPAATPAVAPALAVQDSDEAPGVKVTLLSVKRDPDATLTVRWSYANTTKQRQTLGSQFNGMGSSEAYSLTWGMYVVTNNTKYGVLRQPNGEPVASRHAGRKLFELSPGQTYAAWGKVRDPGPGTKTVTVYIPGVAPFESVSIT